MLSTSQLAYLSIDDPVLYEWLQGLVGSFNQLQKQVGVDVSPASQANQQQAIPAPGQPASLTVSASGGVFQITIGASPNAAAGAQYFLDVSTVPTFDAGKTQTFTFGNTLGLALALGSGSFYFRARTRYANSGYSPYTYYGTAANPTAVVGSAGSGIQIGGDIGGTDTDPLVVGLWGKPIENVAPSAGQMLQFNGTEWAPVSVGAGNATEIQGVPVAATAPADGQVLEYHAANGNWEPATGGGGGANVADLFTVGYPLSSSSDLTNAKANDYAYQGSESAPSSPNAFNDEFNSAGTGTPPGWTLGGGASPTFTRSFSSLHIHDTGTLVLTKALPATPYTVVMPICLLVTPQTGNLAGLVISDAADGTGKLIRFLVTNGTNGSFHVQEYTNLSTFSADLVAPSFYFIPGQMYLSINDDGTNLSFGVGLSADVTTHLTLTTTPRTSFLTSPAVIGIIYQGSANATLAAVDWIRAY